ncbi:MAG: U32 family peptidase, partial [Thalassospira sp.]|nr:U32 family peptidase [Thalassospira sp.]
MKRSRLVMGPVLFHWDEDRKKDFYSRIADETDVDTVHVGEVVCAKRMPFF